MFEWLQSNGDSFFLNMIYDIFKYIVGYLVAQWLYEGVYKQKKYGGWSIDMIDGDKQIGTRVITPSWAERIFSDDYDFSIYVKGYASTAVFLNMDVSSEKAKEVGLITIDADIRKITLDIAKNPLVPKNK